MKKQDKIDLFKDKPKRDGSGKGIRLNKGRGGCKIPRGVGKNMRNLLIGTGAVILGIKGAELLGDL